MQHFPKKSAKRVKIVEEHNTYHAMEDDESSVNAIAAEVKTLFELEETSDVSRDTSLKELDKLKEDRREKEEKIEELSKSTGLYRKNIELGDSYMTELLDLTYKIRDTFQSVSSSLQQRKEVLLSINEVDKVIHSQNYLNKLSLERLQVNYTKKVEEQVKSINTIENEIREVKQFGEETVNRLSAQIDKSNDELEKRKVDVEDITDQNHRQELECEELGRKLKEIKTNIGEASLDIQETNLKRDGMIADIKSFESVYETEMKELTEKCQSLSERVSQQNENCKKLDDAMQREIATSVSIKETKSKLEEENVQVSEEIMISKNLYAQANEEKHKLCEGMKVEEATKQTLIDESKKLLETEIAAKDNELQSLNQLKQIEEKLKSELEDIIIVINEGNQTSSQMNNSIDEIRLEKNKLQQTITNLESSIKETELKLQEIQIQAAEETNVLQSEEHELQKTLQEIKDKINTQGTTFHTDYNNMKAEFKNELEEMDKKHVTEIIDLNKSIEELQTLSDDFKQSIKLLENNLDGIQSECDVISRKMLILERSIRDEKRQKRSVIPVKKKQPIDAMSDSSDDRPNILEIFKRKKEAEMKKAKAKKSRNK